MTREIRPALRYMLRFGAALAGIVVSACTQWNIARGPTPEATDKALKRGGQKRIRVELATGDTMTLFAPRVQGDSVVARRDSARVRRLTAVALSDIRTVEYPGLTPLAIASVAVLLSTLYLVVACAATL